MKQKRLIIIFAFIFALAGFGVWFKFLLVTPVTRIQSATCYPEPQVTNEKIIMPTIESPPPVQASPGQVITIIFSGNYIIFNNAIVCDDTVVRYEYSDEIPDFNWDRSINLFLDEQVLASIECGYTCKIEAIIPKDILLGEHKLVIERNLDGEWSLETYLQNITFDLEITRP